MRTRISFLRADSSASFDSSMASWRCSAARASTFAATAASAACTRRGSTALPKSSWMARSAAKAPSVSPASAARSTSASPAAIARASASATAFAYAAPSIARSPSARSYSRRAST